MNGHCMYRLVIQIVLADNLINFFESVRNQLFIGEKMLAFVESNNGKIINGNYWEIYIYIYNFYYFLTVKYKKTKTWDKI